MSDTPISDAQFNECANMGGKWDRLREVSRDFESLVATERARADKAEEDARRYRWLRDGGSQAWLQYQKMFNQLPVRFDAAIDKAMKGEE